MSGWEAWANAQLQTLNDHRSHRRMTSLAYRQRRRALIQSISQLVNDSSTLRRRQGQFQSPCHGSDPAMPAKTRGHGWFGALMRSWRFRLWLLSMLIGIGLLYWRHASGFAAGFE
jgi:hypothetical protein